MSVSTPQTDLEYYAIQMKWAKLGYIALSYECRGWAGAGGKIGTAGPDDVEDHKSVVCPPPYPPLPPRARAISSHPAPPRASQPLNDPPPPPPQQVDYLYSMSGKWKLDERKKIATAGVSYGGGMAAIAAGNDTRVGAVLSMSGWGNLTTALYGGDTPSLVWGEILMGSGAVDGHEPEELIQKWHELIEHKDVPAVRAWADVRSSLNYLPALCGG